MVSILKMPETQLTSLLYHHTESEGILAVKHNKYYSATFQAFALVKLGFPVFLDMVLCSWMINALCSAMT
jgi:hypothetical protein